MTDDLQPSPSGSALTAALRRSVGFIVILTLLGAALGAYAGYRLSQTHTARASVLVSPLAGNPFNPNGRGDDLVNLESEAQLVSSDAVAQQVAEKVGGGATASQVRHGLSVSVPTNTQILVISYAGKSDAEATERAQAFADSYLDFRSQRATQTSDTQTKQIQSQIDSQTKQLAALTAAYAVELNPGRKVLLRRQLNGVTTQIEQLRSVLAQLQSAPTDPGQVVTPATRVASSTLKSTAALGILGAVLGALLAFLIVAIRSRAENRVHHAEDVSGAGLPVIGHVSASEAEDARHGVAEGTTEVGEGLQALRVAVLTHERARPARILYAAAPGSQGSPHAALGLGQAIAAANLRTAVVDGTGQITRDLGLEDRAGFSDVLTGTASLQSCLVAAGPCLDVLPRGAEDPRADALLSGPAASGVLDALSSEHDIVLIASGPRTAPQAQALAVVTDASLIEAVQGRSRVRDLAAIAEELHETPGVLGVVYIGKGTKAGKSRRARS